MAEYLAEENNNIMLGPKIADSIVDLIGRTPMVRMGRLARENGCLADIVLND